MEVTPLQEIPDSMLDSLVNNMQREWKVLSPAEDRHPFKDKIKSELLHSHSIYYPYCVKFNDSVIGTFTLKEKDMTSFGIRTPDNTIWLHSKSKIRKFLFRCFVDFLKLSVLLETEKSLF